MRAAQLEADGIETHLLNASVNALGVPYSGWRMICGKRKMPESLRRKQERAQEIIKRLRLAYPGARCTLDFENAFGQ